MKKWLYFVLLALILMGVSDVIFAHEQWFLTPKEFSVLSTKPLPTLFTTLNSTNVSMGIFTFLVLTGWILLGRTGARELFPDLQVRLASYGRYAAIFLRFSTAIMLLMAAFGLNPRTGVGYFIEPTLVAPDLQLNLLTYDWSWLKWVEVMIAIGFIFGIYVRCMAFLLLFTAFLGLLLFGHAMVAYVGFLIGISIYLILQGAGVFFIPLPVFPGAKKIMDWLSDQPRGRAQFILRIFAGLNFTYVGIYYKFLHPNLAIGLLTKLHFFTFGLHIETVVLWMAIIETLSGILLLAGVLLRPLAIILFVCFIFLGILLQESLITHIIFYGVLITFYLNGAGQWKRLIAKDKPAKILILGASFAGIHGAMKLQRLLGEASNVQVTLVNSQNYFQFEPLLSEVIGGSVQASNIVNPIRRICPRIQFIQGEIKKIDHQAQQVDILLLSGNRHTLHYDQLIISSDREAEYLRFPGLLEYSLPIMDVADALRIRQRILECLEQAEMVKDKIKQKELLTFSIIGGGLKGCSVAADIQTLIQSALVSFPSITQKEIAVLLFEKTSDILYTFDMKLAQMAHKKLAKMGILIKTNIEIKKITLNQIICSSGEVFLTNLIVCALSKYHPSLKAFPKLTSQGRIIVDKNLRPKQVKNVFVAGISTALETDADFQIFQALREAKMGECAAYNAWAASQGYPLQKWTYRHIFYLVTLGRYASVAKIFGVPVTGISAWFISRYVCLMTLPGLERNLRILIDWIMDIPFRQDIVTISPTVTSKLGHVHFEKDNEIIHQGDRGDCAYLILSGEVAVLKTEDRVTKQVATLQKGDLFGEITSVEDILRTETIKCLTSVDVIVLPREQFVLLLAGFKDLEEVIKERIKKRMRF